jgi:transposase
VSTQGLNQFVAWVEEKPSVVALEGIDGQSAPIEKALREAGVVFYSFKPSECAAVRKVVLGENKDNEADAEAVARFALLMKEQGRLERWRRVWEVDEDLRLLSRRYESVGRQMNGEVNRLWKLVRRASGDLYLLLGGKLEREEKMARMLGNVGVLRLLATKPQMGEWKGLSDDELMEAMGGGEYKGRRAFVRQLKEIAPNMSMLSRWMSAVIHNSAQQLLLFRGEQGQIESGLQELGGSRPAVQVLKQKRGVGILTAAGIVAEIIDIRRFPSEEKLARYSGLADPRFATGARESTRRTGTFNHRLKDWFMTAGKNIVHMDPGSHLAGYYRGLIKKGMDAEEALKRVARALVRVIYRDLRALVTGPAEDKGGPSNVASDQGRGTHGHRSNTPPRTPRSSRAQQGRRVKRGAAKAAEGRTVGRPERRSTPTRRRSRAPN